MSNRPDNWRTTPGAICGHCKKPRTAGGHDPCIANLPGVTYACCGMALIDLDYDPDPLSDQHHGDRIEATMWAEFEMPPPSQEARHG